MSGDPEGRNLTMDCQRLTNVVLAALSPAFPVNDDARGGCLTRNDYADGNG